MASIRGRDTKPELQVRRLLRAAGATGYRLHRKDVLGRPDVTFFRWKVAVVVDGAFWHGHPDVWPPEREATPYWVNKIARNRARDQAVNVSLVAGGWTVVRIWDCDLHADPAKEIQRVLDALHARGWPMGPA